MGEHAEYMVMALEQAGKAAASGEVPVGAVLLMNGNVLSRSHNSREGSADPTAHAEVMALREAARLTGDWRLDGATLYVTLEPCAMCAAAVVLARVATVVFGATDIEAGAGGSAYDILEDGRLGHRVEVIGGILEVECGALLKEFFAGARSGMEEKRGDA